MTARAVAVLAGFVSVAALSLATDQALHLTLGESHALALSYRLFYGVLGGYITARFAPYAPIHHAVILGLVASVLSPIVTTGPAWYLIALALAALPASALGGVLYCKQSRDQRERSALKALSNPLLFPYTFHLPECDDFQAPDFAAPSSSGSTPPAQSKNPFRGS
jgi:hypothetical protein